jgi:hypothetical protein
MMKMMDSKRSQAPHHGRATAGGVEVGVTHGSGSSSVSGSGSGGIKTSSSSSFLSVEAPKPHRIPSPAIIITSSVPSLISTSISALSTIAKPGGGVGLVSSTSSASTSTVTMAAVGGSAHHQPSNNTTPKRSSINLGGSRHHGNEEHKVSWFDGLSEDDRACREVQAIMCARARAAAAASTSAASPQTAIGHLHHVLHSPSSTSAWSPSSSAALIAGFLPHHHILSGTSPSSKPSSLRDLPPRLGAPSPSKSTWRVRDHKVGEHERYPSGDASLYIEQHLRNGGGGDFFDDENNNGWEYNNEGSGDAATDDARYYQGDDIDDYDDNSNNSNDDDDSYLSQMSRPQSSRAMPIAVRGVTGTIAATTGGAPTVGAKGPKGLGRRGIGASSRTWPRLSCTM